MRCVSAVVIAAALTRARAPRAALHNLPEWGIIAHLVTPEAGVRAPHGALFLYHNCPPRVSSQLGHRLRTSNVLLRMRHSCHIRQHTADLQLQAGPMYVQLR